MMAAQIGSSPTLGPAARDSLRMNRSPDPETRRVSVNQGKGSSPQPSTPGEATPDRSTPGGSTPGDMDLPWKATAQRRDLWGPMEKPLEGTVHSPASTDLTRPRRRSPLLTLGVPLLTGGAAALGTVALGIAGVLALPLALVAGAGVGVIAAGGAGGLLHALRPRPTNRQLLISADIPDSTREMLEQILQATATTRSRTRELRSRASEPTALSMLKDVDSLLRRIDALAESAEIQSLRPSSGELTMLEGIAARYVPELMDSAERTIGFLTTFQGDARAEALENLRSIDQQLDVLAEGIEQIEQDVVSGVSRSLEVHSEFLRTRFADQHLNPIIDV